jgi:dGTPase
MNWSQILSYQRSTERKVVDLTSQEIRSEFERDYDRVIFSQAFRSLQDKTQVMPLPEDDFVHTRLTHTLEVASVGRSLGKKVGKTIIERNPELDKVGFSPFDFGAIVSAACLAHDLGNPPFGHSGESAISDFFISNPIANEIKNNTTDAEWLDLIQFEGNAQGFRMLCYPERYGMKLTFATMTTFSKYPRSSSSSKNSNRISQKKYGFFQSEQAEFSAVAGNLQMVKLSHDSWARTPLTFLVEAADNICYHIIDLEDSASLGLLSFKEYEELLVPIISDRYDPGKIKQYQTQTEKLAVLRAMAIGKLIEEVTTVFLDKEEELLNGSFDNDLFDLLPVRDSLKRIIETTIQRYYRTKTVLEIEASGYRVISGLLQVILPSTLAVLTDNNFTSRDKSIFSLLPEYIQVQKDKGMDVYSISRLCLDYISGLSDKAAVSLYKKLNGLNF